MTFYFREERGKPGKLKTFPTQLIVKMFPTRICYMIVAILSLLYLKPTMDTDHTCQFVIRGSLTVGTLWVSSGESSNILLR